MPTARLLPWDDAVINTGSSNKTSASTASGSMLSRTDGFDTMPGLLFPGIASDSSGSCGGAMTVQRNNSGLDMTVLYPTRDPFPLPPILQAHLHETYAASSVVLTRVEGGGDDGAHRGLYQVTFYRPQNSGGRDGRNVPGPTPLAYPSFRGVASSTNHLGGTIIEFGDKTDARGQTLVQLSQLPQRFTDNNSKKMTAVTRNDDDEEYSSLSTIVVAKKLQSARERKNENERLRYQAKRQKRQEEAIDQEHPMIKLLVNSRKNSSKLIQLVSDGIVKKVLMSYFVTGQTNKLSDKFIKTVDGCEEVTRHLILSCLNPHIPDLSKMKDEITYKKPLSTDNSNRAQTIILRLFPE